MGSRLARRQPLACGATLNCLLVPYMPLAFTITRLTLAVSGERGHARLRSTETAVHKELVRGRRTQGAQVVALLLLPLSPRRRR